MITFVGISYSGWTLDVGYKSCVSLWFFLLWYWDRILQLANEEGRHLYY